MPRARQWSDDARPTLAQTSLRHPDVHGRRGDDRSCSGPAACCRALEATTPSLRLTDASPRQARHLIAQVANERIDTATRDDLVLALSETVENAQLHGRGPTTVTAWTGPDRVVVRVHDSGPGPANPLAGLVRDRSSGGGRGLWISHQLARVDIALVADAEGFTVRLRALV